MSLVAGAGFFAYLLNNILWLHYVWDWSLLVSGLAVAPAALVAAAAAGPFGKLADAHGHGVVAAFGALVWMGAYLWYAGRVGTQPHFVTEWLPGQVLSGVGVAATLPVLGSAALAAVPGGRFATASSVVTSARQLGGVIGIAVLVVVVGAPTTETIATHLRHGWLLSAGCFAAVAVGAVFLRGDRETVDEGDGAPLAPQVEFEPPAEAPTRNRGTSSAFLAALPTAARSRLLENATELAVPAGATLFESGDPSDAAYVVRTGRLDVVVNGEVIRELGADDVVGELGLVAGTPRSATIRARRDSTLLRIAPEVFEEALRSTEGAHSALIRALALQLQQSRGLDEARPATPRVVAVVAATPSEAAREFTSALCDALRTRGCVAILTESQRDGLDNAERTNDCVVLLASDSDKGWRSACVRQADRVVVVAGARDRPEAAGDRHAYLVFVDARPSQAELTAWHDALSPRRSWSSTAAEERLQVAEELADRLSGRSVAVALAGGGARAFAGIGVLAELEAAGIRVNRLSGCSLGGIVASLYATGMDAAAVDAACYEEFVRRNPLGDFALPRVALTRGRRADAALRRAFGDTLIEELSRQLALVSTDMLGHRTVTHTRGRVRDALRASLSLPVLLPPVRLGDTIHLDGGILDNLPVRALDADEGPTIAVNITSSSSLRRDGSPPRMPALSETLMRSMLMGSAAAVTDARRNATVTVTPDTRGIGLFEFHQIDRAVEAGRAAGVAAIEALRRYAP